MGVILVEVTRPGVNASCVGDLMIISSSFGVPFFICLFGTYGGYICTLFWIWEFVRRSEGGFFCLFNMWNHVFFGRLSEGVTR